MKMIEIICFNCGKKCEKPTKEVIRQEKAGRKIFYCSRSCSTTTNKTITKKIKRKCLWCDKEFESSTHKRYKKCCSKNCASKYARSKCNPVKHKFSCQRSSLFPMEREFICVYCGNKFCKIVQSNVDFRKTCSVECYKKYQSRISVENPNCGGETNYRKFKYNGIWMDSSWEMNLAKWMDKNGIKWDRNRKRHMFWWIDQGGNKRRYYPDFHLPDHNIYVDTKNPYLLDKDEEKIKSVIKENKIKLLVGNLEYVKKELTSFLEDDIVLV